MSRPLTVARYPAAYLTLAGEFEGERPQRQRDLVCANKSEAVRLRLDLYGFRRAMQAERVSADYPNFMLCRLFVEGRTVRIKHADDCLPKALRPHQGEKK